MSGHLVDADGHILPVHTSTRNPLATATQSGHLVNADAYCLFNSWTWRSTDLPLWVRTCFWYHPGRPKALVQMLPVRSSADAEEGVISFLSSLTYSRTEFHGFYRVDRRKGELDKIFLEFRYCGDRAPVELVKHTLTATMQHDTQTYRDIHGWQVMEMVWSRTDPEVLAIEARADERPFTADLPGCREIFGDRARL